MTKNWELFGVSLGVHVRMLNRIKLDDPNGGVENWKLKMFQFWLQYKPDASWKDVVRALEDNDYCLLAATLSKKCLLATDSSDDDDNGGSNSFVYIVLSSYYLHLQMKMTITLKPKKLLL